MARVKEVPSVSTLVEIAGRLQPEFSKLTGFVRIGVSIPLGAPPRLIARIKHADKNRDSFWAVRESLKSLGLPYVIHDDSKIDRVKELARG